MAGVNLEIGGQIWPMACRDGDEAQMEALGRMLDERWELAQRAAGDAGLPRVMLTIALMLADELTDMKASAAGNAPALGAVAERLEKLAAALEREGVSA